MLNIEWSLSGLIKLPTEIRLQVLHLAAKKIGVQHFHCSPFWDLSDTPWSQSRWLALVRDLSKAGTELTAIHDGRTALMCMWSFSSHRWGEYLFVESRMEAVFNCWIQMMQDANVDLRECIQREQQAWATLGPRWNSREVPAQSGLWLRPYQVERLICASRPDHCGFTNRRQKLLHVWQESEMPGSWSGGMENHVGATLVTSTSMSAGGCWTTARSINTLSNPVDIRLSGKRNRRRDIRLCATLETTQDDADL